MDRDVSDIPRLLAFPALRAVSPFTTTSFFDKSITTPFYEGAAVVEDGEGRRIGTGWVEQMVPPVGASGGQTLR
jgi:hypothetical protein